MGIGLVVGLVFHSDWILDFGLSWILDPIVNFWAEKSNGLKAISYG